jgi:hypothetical protein
MALSPQANYTDWQPPLVDEISEIKKENSF